jgi:hypothetical protein
MRITHITVTAGRTFNHPREQYSNLRPEVVLRAELAEGDDPSVATQGLQAQAEKLVEDHKQGLLRSIEELHELGEVRAEFLSLDSQLRRHQERLEEIRKAHPGIAEQLTLTGGAPDND